MFVARYAYRFPDNSVMGFSQVRFMRNNAIEACLTQIRNMCYNRDIKFEQNKVIQSPKGLSRNELDRIKSDWKIDERG